MKVKCDYCGDPAELKKGVEVYPKRPELKDLNFWQCLPCGARVGTHKGTEQPYGRLANTQLRYWKIQAHAVFDPLWRRKIERDGISKTKARKAAYTWLSEKIGVKYKDCHIGMFNVDQCKSVVDICSPYMNKP